MSATFTFEGGRELEQMLRALGNSREVRRAAREALREAAAPMVATAKALAPREVGNLAQSIATATGKRDRGDDGDQVAVVIGINSSVQPDTDVQRKTGEGTYRDPGVAGVAHLQEFGDQPRMPATPFMRPAWDTHKDATPGRIGEALGLAIERAGQRIARRGARGR